MPTPISPTGSPQLPPPTAVSEPIRPSTSRRPKTASRKRPHTTRPDTSASGIGELPEQEFFPEGDDLDEEEEDWDDEEEDEVKDGDVFAFARPKTGAVPNLAFSDTSGSVPPTRGGMPTTAGTYTTNRTTQTGGTFGSPVLNDQRRPSVVSTNSIEPTGQQDVGGHLPQLVYDVKNPAPFSGRNNPNNSAFAFHPPPRTGETSMTATSGGKSFLSRFRRANPQTASTSYATTSDVTGSRGSFDSETGSIAGSFRTETTGTDLRAPNHRTRSKQPLINGSAAGDSVAQTATSRGISRGSYGLTEMTGDMTVPDGKTTWGDGLGGVIKEDGDSLQGIDMDEQDEDSPYPEVRASVSNIDDPDMPVVTFRSYSLGCFMAILIGACNTFFFLRNPSPYINPLVVQLLAFPLGKAMAWLLPIRSWQLPRFLGGHQFSLNPGPFNIKEHALITIMANAAIAPPYALNTTVVLDKYYGRTFGAGFEILIVWATQLTGFAFSGLFNRFLVTPASMIWPSDLVAATNLNTLHADADGFQGGMSRMRFLVIAMSGAFAWYFFPGFIFTGLSYFSWVCWIAPQNRVVNILFGVTTGSGMGLLTFDWQQIIYIGNPLSTPWWASVNIGIGFIFLGWITILSLYFCNVWQTAYIPLNAVSSADRFGSRYNVSMILTPDFHLNETAYADYSPVYLSASTCVLYLSAFALSTALIVHTALHHGPRIYHSIARLSSEPDDIHAKLIRRYRQVPFWWYLYLFGATFVVSIITIEVFHTGMPVWGYIISILIPLAYLLPAGFILAMTNQVIPINLLAELIPGYLFPGKPLPGMIAKAFSVQTISSGLNFSQDQKLGHYMKIPPRAVFLGQVSVASFTCLVQIGVKQWVFSTVSDVCSPDQANLLTCPQSSVFFTASIIWGLVGPSRLFSQHATYHPLTYAAIAGAIIPIPMWIWLRRYPTSMFRNMNIPVILTGISYIPPATGVNYTSYLATAFIFNFWIRRRHFAWWSKYNFVLSAALDVGTALSAIFIFLTLGLTQVNFSWWGNNVWQNTLDAMGGSYKDAPITGFGPDTWK